MVGPEQTHQANLQKQISQPLAPPLLYVPHVIVEPGVMS